MQAIYIHAPTRSCYVLSGNGTVYYTMTYVFWGIRVWSWRILLNFCRVSIFFDNLIPNIESTVYQTAINRTIFWKGVVRSFKCFYVNCFNRLRFLAEVSTKLQKNYFIGQFKACVRYFLSILYFFYQVIALQKLWKIFFISSKKLFLFLRYSIFCIFVFPSF